MFFVLGFSLLSLAPAQERTSLLSETEVQRHGLTRSWFHQIGIDVDRTKVLYAALESDLLVVVSSDAKVHALDSETGELRWERQAGERNRTTFEPALNSRMIAIVNGFDVLVMDRRDGKLLWQATLPGTPGAGCELSEYYVYVPLMNGRMVAYCLEDQMSQAEEAAATSTRLRAGEPEKPLPAINKISDPELDKIAKSFEAAKRTVLPPPVEEVKEEPIVLDRGSVLPLVCQAFGHSWLQPTICSQSLRFDPPKTSKDDEGPAAEITPDDLLITGQRDLVSWTTDRSMVFIGMIENFSTENMLLRYQVSVMPQTYTVDRAQTVQLELGGKGDIVARPTFLYADPPVPPRGKQPKRSSRLFVGTRSGYVFPIDDNTSEVAWQFSATGPIDTRVAPVGDRVYACSAGGGMHALEVESGDEVWFTPHMTQFVAMSGNRLYAIDNMDNLAVLDRETGAVQSAFPVRKYKIRFFNVETDRIFLITETGLVQMLHERRVCPDPNCAKPLSATGADECIHAREASKPIRFRPTCAEYLQALRLAGMPRTIGEDPEDGAEDAESTEGEGEDEEEEESGEEETPAIEDEESDPFE